MTGSDYGDEISMSINFQCLIHIKCVKNMYNNVTENKMLEKGY